MSNDAISRIDKFIKQLDDHDIFIDTAKLGKNWGYYQKTKRLFGYKNQYVGTFAEMFAKQLALYQQARNSTDSWLRTISIDEALYWINQAHAWNIVKPSDGIHRKYEEAMDQIENLKKEIKEKEDELQTVSTELLDSEVERRTLKHQLEDLRNKKES